MTVKAAVLTPNGTVLVSECPKHLDQLTWLQGLVGGYIEPLPVIGGADDYQMFVNEDGLSMRLPVNQFASAWTDWQHVRALVGNVVFTGPTDANGATTSLSDQVIDRIRLFLQEMED